MLITESKFRVSPYALPILKGQPFKNKFVCFKNEGMKKRFFKILVWLNNRLLPKLSGKDPLLLTKFEQALTGFRYWALKNAL